MDVVGWRLRMSWHHRRGLGAGSGLLCRSGRRSYDIRRQLVVTASEQHERLAVGAIAPRRKLHFKSI